MSLTREYIREAIYVERTLPIIEEGIGQFFSNVWKSTKTLLNDIKNAPSYQFCLLEKGNETVVLITTKQKASKVLLDGTTIKQETPISPSQFKKEIDKYIKDGYEVERTHGGYYRLLVKFMRGGETRALSGMVLLGLALVIMTLVTMFPALASISIGGVFIGTIVAGFGVKALVFSAGRIIVDIGLSNTAKKKMKIEDDILVSKRP